jgi:arylsulfatase A
MKHVFQLALPGLIAAGCTTGKTQEEVLPNFIVIVADDLGYGDIGCFGATDIKTPHIDKMAERGLRLTSAYAASSICSPSRAAMLTGRYPQRMGINGVFFPESYTGIPETEITIAELLKPAGYSTGIIGKWHLGHLYPFLPLQNGFDEYFGIPFSNDMAGLAYMRGNKPVEAEVDQRYTTRIFTSETKDFIRRNHQKPFFLMLSYAMPHVPLYVPDELRGRSERGLYGDVVEEIDMSVGEVLQLLDSLQISRNTMVIFTSDNGPWLVMRDHGGSSGKLSGGKMYTFEGSMRVPTVVYWPGKIAEGQVNDDPVTLMDLFPTITSLSGVSVPNDRPIDGKDISPLLLGKEYDPYREFLYLYRDKLEGFRAGDWKVHLEHPGFAGVSGRIAINPYPLSLFHLKTDPGEQQNLAQQEPEMLQEMLLKMDSAYRVLGELPPSMITQKRADQYHFEYLREKYGPRFFNTLIE